MSFKKNEPITPPVEGHNDIEPLSDDMLDSVSGAGNPWENVASVPLHPIEDDIWKQNTNAPDAAMNAQATAMNAQMRPFLNDKT